MSFINYKDRLFRKKESPRTKLPKSNPVNSLSFISQSTDPRAWSIDPADQRDYILNALNGNLYVRSSESKSSTSGSSESSGKWKNFKKMSEWKKKKLLIKKTKISENVYTEFMLHGIRNEDLNEDAIGKENYKINELVEQKEKAELSAQKAREEVDNLRNLVKDVQDELALAQSLKKENFKLRTQLNVDLNLECQKAQDEINYLSSQLDIFKNYQEEYYKLKESYHNLKQENKDLNLSLVKFSADNSDMKRVIDEYQGVNCRELYASNAIVDREVLRERVRLRDESINFLKSVVEEQQYIINDMAIKLERLAANVSNKDVILHKHMEALKYALDEKNNRIMYLEEKLHTSDLLIRELENLREQFRLMSSMMNENMINYRNQFISVVSCSEKLLTERETIEEKINEKEELIKKLSRFPQSPRTVVYLSQILHILKKSENSVTDSKETIFSYVPSIRRIVDNIKSELWNQGAADSIISFTCITTQTEILIAESFTQCEIHTCNKAVEADIQDKLYFENQNLRNAISEMRNSVSSLEGAYYKKDILNKELEKKNITLTNDLSSNGKELIGLKNEVNLMKEKLLILKDELEYNEKLLKKALEEIDLEQNAREFTSDLLSISLDSTLREYNNHLAVLEAYISDKEIQIEHLQNYVNEQISSTFQHESDYILTLENEIKRLSESNVKEKDNVTTLTTQISSLKQTLAEKKCHFINIKEKLKKAETLFERISILTNSNQSLDNSEHTKNMEPEDFAENASNNILLFGEKIQNHLKEENSIRDKLRKETYSKNHVENMIKSYRMKNKKLKSLNKQLSSSIIKLRREIIRSNNKIKTSELQISNFKSIIRELENNYKKVNEENNNIFEQFTDSLNEINSIKLMVSVKERDYEELKFEKNKMENVLMGIIANLDHSLSVRREKESIGTITDVDDSQIKSLTSKNKELSAVILQLQDRLDNLLYVPEKEKHANDFVCVGIQTVNSEKDKLNEMEMHFKDILKKRDTAYEKQTRQIIKRSNHKIRTFKRYLKMIMSCVQENLVKMQAEHTQEIVNLQNLQKEQLKPLVNQREIENYYNIELEKLKQHYEDKLLSKDEELKKGIHELRVEIQNIITMKEDTINKIKEVTKIRMEYLKKKFKSSLRKLKKDLKRSQKMYDNLKSKMTINEVEKVGICCQIQYINKEYNQRFNKWTQTVLFKQSNKSTSFDQSCIVQDIKNNESQTDFSPKVIEEQEECIVTLDQGNLPKPNRNHIIFHLPPAKNFDINYKESITCSIKKTKGTFLRDIFPTVPAYKGSGDAPIRDLCLMKDKNLLVSRIEDLEENLMQKTEDFYRNVNMYQETIRRQKTKLKEMEYALNQESVQIYHLQHRLGVEFNRAELLNAERNVLRDYVDSLQRYIKEHLPNT